MTKYFLALLLAATVRQGLADDIAPAAPRPVPVPYPTASAAPVYSVTPAPGPATAVTAANGPYAAQTPADPSPYQDKLSESDHLLQAARHLEAAGLSNEAARFRQLADKEKASAPTVAIQVELRMVELPLGKLTNTTSERYGGSKDMSVQALLAKLCSGSRLPGDRGSIPSTDAKLLALIESLGKDGFVEVLCTPSLQMVSGRPAWIQVGGMRADVLASVVANDRVHLDFRLRVSQLDNTDNMPIAGMPPMKNREMEAGMDLRSGQTAVVEGSVEWRNDSNGEPMQTFVLARAQIVPIGAAAKDIPKKQLAGR